MQQWITMTADDARMNVIIWIHIFSFLKPHLEPYEFIIYLKDYLTHEGINLHMASVLV